MYLYIIMGCLKIHTLEIERSPLKVVYRKGQSCEKVVQWFYGVDPLGHKYPGMSPYNFVGNNPINNIDINGDSITPVGANQHLQMGIINWDKGVNGGNGYTLYGGTGTNSEGQKTQMWVARLNVGDGMHRDDYVIDPESVGNFVKNSGSYKGIANLANYYSKYAGMSLFEGYQEVMSNPFNWVGGASAYAGTFGKLALVQRNRNIGNAFRDEVADVFESQGRSVAKEVYKKTPFGGRYIDVEVSTSNGTILGGVEAKVGGSPYTISQRAKDYYLKTVLNYPVNVIRKKN
jgi:hypothetical protein